MADTPEERNHWQQVIKSYDGYMQYHVRRAIARLIICKNEVLTSRSYQRTMLGGWLSSLYLKNREKYMMLWDIARS